MYNNISNDAKTALKSRVVTTTARITLTSNNQVIDGNNLVNVTITDQCYQDGVIVGTAMCKEVEIELRDNNYDLADKEFSLEVGVLLPNNSYEYIPYGNFIVKDYQKIISSNHYKLIAYDYMDKFNPTFVDNNPTLEDGVTYTTPMTLQSFYQYVANQYNVTIETQSNLPNANFSITTKPYLEGLSGRNVLSRIAEMMGCFAKINRNNKLEMKLKTTTSEKFSRNEMNNSLERDNRFGPINVISLRLSQVEGENVTKRDEASISQYGETTLQIQDNPFCYTEALRLAAINAIYNKVDGFSYYPTTFNGKLIYLDVGDEVEVQDMETDTYYKTIILKQVLKIPSTRNSKFENKALTNVGLEHQFTPEQVRKDRRTEYLVDKQNGVIQQIVETTEEIEREIETITDTKGQAEGKYIYLDDSSDNTLISAKFNGETSQATRSGKNLLDVIATTQTINGVTFTVNSDKTVTVNGTATARAVFYLTSSSNFQKLNIGEYKFTGCPAQTGRDYFIEVYRTNPASYPKDYGTGNTLSITDDTQKIVTYIVINEGVTVNNILFKPMIRLASVTDDTYEQYGVMPSPDYPSEIKNLKRKNIFDKDNANILNAYLSGGKVITSSANDRTIYIPCKANTTYTLSKMVQQTTANNRLALAYSSNLPTLGGSFTERVFLANGTTQTSLSITTDSNAKYLLAYIYYQDTNTTFEEMLDSIQIEEGTVATPYAPYNSLEVKVINKNLLGLPNIAETTALGLQYSVNNGEITLNGTATSGGRISIPLTTPIKCINGNSYALSKVENYALTNHFNIQLRDTANSTNIKNLYENSLPATYTDLSGTIGYLGLYIGNGHSFSNYKLKLQLEKEIATEYEEYKEQIVYFPLAEGQKLYRGSYLADDGIHNVRGQVVFDGSSDEDWKIWALSGNNVERFYINITNSAMNKEFKSSHFIMSSLSDNGDYEHSRGAASSGQYIQWICFISKSKATTAAEFKTWLSSNPVTLEYTLNQEEVIPYNTEQQAAWNSIKSLHTYKTVTHIYSDAYAEIEYVKDNGLDIYETKASANVTKNDVAQLKIENGRISSEVSSTQSQFNNYYTKNEADNNTNSTKAELQNIIQQNKTEIEQTTRDISFRINEIETNGVDKIETSMGYTFNNEGLNIDKEGAATASTIDNEAFKVKNKSSNENVFFAGYVSDQSSAYRGQTIVESTNLVVKNYLNIEGASRFQPYVNPVLGGHGTGAFDIG